jgi:hypothetical protein
LKLRIANWGLPGALLSMHESEMVSSSGQAPMRD